MESFTITFSDTKSNLTSTFFPTIDLDGQYEIGLVDFQSYMSIFNVRQPFNVLYYHEVKKVEIPLGTYTVDQLNDIIKDVIRIEGKNIRTTNTDFKPIAQLGVMKKIHSLVGDKLIVSQGDDLYYYSIKEKQELRIPPGMYEVSEIAAEVRKTIPTFKITADNRTMMCILYSDKVFDFTGIDLGSLILGFSGKSTPFIDYSGTTKANINHVNVIRIDCNIASGSYLNGKVTHTIHEFYPTAPAGYKLIEVPRNIIYFPINVRTLDVVTV